MGAVGQEAIARGAVALGLGGRPLCLHVSMRSFEHLERGAQTVVDGLLDAGCTVMVPSFSHQFEVAPPQDDRPERNGIDYSVARAYAGDGHAYRPDAPIEPWLGAVPAHVVARTDSARGADAVGSFAAVGPFAGDLLVGEGDDIFGPLRALAHLGGWVVLMGVGLNRMTLLHLAEFSAGRRPFIRWVNGPGGQPIRLGVGLCSEGFPKLEDRLAYLARTTNVGASTWRAYPASETLAAAASEIRRNPSLTHCGRECIECRDAIAGGPIA